MMHFHQEQAFSREEPITSYSPIVQNLFFMAENKNRDSACNFVCYIFESQRQSFMIASSYAAFVVF